MSAYKGIKNHKEDVGKSCGSLTLLDIVREGGRTFCMVKCICGNIRTSIFKTFINNKYDECRCDRAAHASKAGKGNISTNTSSKRLYQIWENLKQRCYNSKSRSYKKYGGKGIIVCDLWKNSYVEFEKWALKNAYSDNLTLNRKNNNGNYEPANCNWITNFEQQANTSKNVYVTYNGETKHLSEWGRMFGICRSKLSYRMRKGWSLDKLFIQ